jgi:hypothetical protein
MAAHPLSSSPIRVAGFFNLGEIPMGTGGLLYSSAPNFTTLKRNFVITNSSMSYAFPFQPTDATSSRR